jgi:hypothetical protein
LDAVSAVAVAEPSAGVDHGVPAGLIRNYDLEIVVDAYDDSGWWA